jgi:hypothetical protein
VNNIKIETTLPITGLYIMVSKKDEAFLRYWEENRIKEKSIIKQFFPGLPIGLSLGAAILLLLDSGWYERANMVAQSQSSPVVLFIAIAGIVAFTGFFYKKFRWEMNEQAYQELKLKNTTEERDDLANVENEMATTKD